MAELVREIGGDVAADQGQGQGQGQDQGQGHLGGRVRALRIRIPFPGCQSDILGGFPLCAVPDKIYKIRVKLRPLSELVTWGTGEGEGPWGKTFTDAFGNVLYTAIQEYELGSPAIVLETTQAYLSREARGAILERAASPEGIKIPFITHYEQSFQIRTDGRKPYLLEPKHPSEGIYIYARAAGAAKKDISAAAISSIEFTLAGREREFDWGEGVLVDIAAHAKMITPPTVRGIYTLNWSLGDIGRPRSQDPMIRRPEGTVNFSEADKPTLYVTPNPAVVTRNGPVYIMHVIVESWRLYDIQADGYGRVAFI
jgi:hypothetical protein